MFKKIKEERNEDGFSLLEMVACIGLLGILTAGGLLAYGDMIKNVKQDATTNAVEIVSTMAKLNLQDGDFTVEPQIKVDKASKIYNDENHNTNIEVSTVIDPLTECLLVEAVYIKDTNIKHSETFCEVVPQPAPAPAPYVPPTPPTPPTVYGEKDVVVNPNSDGNYIAFTNFMLSHENNETTEEFKYDNVSYELKYRDSGTVITNGSEDDIVIRSGGDYYIDLRFWHDYTLHDVPGVEYTDPEYDIDGNIVKESEPYDVVYKFAKFEDVVLTVSIDGESHDILFEGNDIRTYPLNHDPERELGLYGEMYNPVFTDEYYDVEKGEWLIWELPEVEEGVSE